MNASRRTASGGFTMIELMLAMLLGLVVVGGVIGVFLATQQTYRTNDALSEVQENSRLAFEILTHDIRNAQLTGCNNDGRVANVLSNSGAAWWANWNNALRGYTGGDPALAGSGQVANTDSIQLLGAADTGMSVQTHTPGQFTINGNVGNLQNGDIVIVCDPDHAVLLKVTNAAPPITYDAKNNCTTGLGFPTNCDGGTGNAYTFHINAQIAPLSAVDWYVGNNPVGGTSLYRMALVNTGGAPTPTAQEMVRNITGMTLTYLQQGTAQFVPAKQVANWAQVSAVQVNLAMQSTFQRAGTNAQPLIRNYTATVTLYNRVN
jgi:type IV pilus assembly protein PilW